MNLERPENDICPLDVGWARFLVHHSGDVRGWRRLFGRLMRGDRFDDPRDDDDGNDDDDDDRRWSGPRKPAPRPLEPAGGD